MVFSSSIFLFIFLPIVFLLYFISPGINAKNIVLLTSSLLFYAWGEPKYIFLMIISILANYGFGLWIPRIQKKNMRKAVLGLAVLTNLGLLFYFKYFNFAVDTLSALLRTEWNVKNVALPIGISFYTFQGMSYVIDVYREEQCTAEKSIAQKSLIKLAMYISMFPQLIAGPIVRYSDICPRLSSRAHTLENFAEGIEIFIIGLAKKVIFANLLGEMADEIIGEGLAYISAVQAWVSALLYMLQIYYDFGGYSEMAIGLGKMFGFEFMQNFNYPYISRSITEFWRRWHISLSTWFRDYLYIPLGGNRRGNVYVNLSIVFLATGIWHGADWQFVLWGIWHGLFMLIERVVRNKKVNIPLPGRIKPVLGWVYTMLVVFFGWILFRLNSISYTYVYFKILLGLTKPEFVPYDLTWFLNRRTVFILIIAILCCVPWKQFMQYYIPKIENLWLHPFFVVAKRVGLILLFGVCFMLITNSTYNPFIYFQF